MLDTILKDKRGNMDMTDLGRINVTDAMLVVLFSFAVLVEFLGAGFTIPLPNSSLALGDTAFSIGATNVSYALLIGLVLFAVQLVQSAQEIGRADDVDIVDYIDRVPMLLSIGIIFTVGIHVMALFEGDVQLFADIVSGTQSAYWRQVATVVVMTVAYMGTSRYN